MTNNKDQMQEFLAAQSKRVLIVGAGPTGLTLANALTRYKIGFTIIDQKPGPTYESKGLALNAPSIYGFETIGHEGIFGKSGCHVHRLNILWEGRKFSAVDLRHLPFHIRSFITKPQATTEQELIDALEKQGQTVAWLTRLVDVVETANGVDAIIEDKNGVRTTHRYDYVVGCDGKRSLIRDKINAEFTGPDYDMHFVLGDFEMAWDRKPEQAFYYVYNDKFFVFVPISETLWRVVVKHDGVPNHDIPPSPKEITEPVAQYIGCGLFRDEQPSWLSRAQFYTRTTSKMRQGRLFLAGDSAHLVSPIGGTGMNSGMIDALNLAWKLAQVLHGYATDTLLETYEPERLEAVRATATAADRSTRIIARMDKDESLIDPFVPRMSNRRALRSTLPMNFSGLGLSYRNAFAARGLTSENGLVKPGDLSLGFARIRSFLGSSAERLSSMSLLGIINLNGTVDVGVRNQMDEIMNLQIKYGTILQWCVFASDPAGEDLLRLSRAGVMVFPHDETLLWQLAVEDGGVMVLLPDAIVGYSGPLTSTARLQGFISEYWTPQTSEVEALPVH